MSLAEVRRPTTVARAVRRASLVALVAGLAIGQPPPAAGHPSDPPGVEHWIASWAAAAQLTEPHNMPPAPGLARRTLVQNVLLSIGGDGLRILLSNQYGRSALVVEGASVAVHGGAPSVESAAGRTLTFGGDPGAAIPAGQTVLSDPVALRLPDRSGLTVRLSLGDVPEEITGHPGSRTTSTILEAAPPTGEGPRTTDHWYFLTRVEVASDPSARALVILGDSIADGRGSTTNGNDRWPDVLARRLSEREGRPPLAVLNQGVGGNRVLTGGLGPPVLERYRRDALDIEHVRYLVLSAGVNDVGSLGESEEDRPQGAVADALIAAYSRIATEARERSILVYAATLMPFEGSFYFSEEGERQRRIVNAWIRETPLLDGVIDFDRITRDPQHPSRLSSAVDGGDHLHPSAAGYAIMGAAVPLELFER